MPTPTEFVETAIKSGLYSMERFHEMYKHIHDRDPKTICNELIRLKEMSAFQAEKLQQGLWQGLVMGEYRVLEPIGRGGMGIVYLCAKGKTNFGPRRALKIIPPKIAREEPRRLERFLREIQIGQKIPHHQNIVQTIEGGEVGGVNYLAMDFAPGDTLKKRIQDHGPMQADEAIGMAIGLADGLSKMHEQKIIHRDFKPANIILHPTGHAKILDFGFAIQLGEQLPNDPKIIGGQGYVVGTMDYIPPEQIKDATKVTEVSDLYALGCTLFFALTGTPPYPGGDTQMKMKWHQTSEIPDVREINPNVPARFAEIISTILDKDPSKRLRSSLQVREALKSLGRPWVVTVHPSGFKNA